MNSFQSGVQRKLGLANHNTFLKTSLYNHFDCKIGKDYIIKNFKGVAFGGFAISSTFILAWIVKSQTYTIDNNNNDWYSLEPAEMIF